MNRATRGNKTPQASRTARAAAAAHHPRRRAGRPRGPTHGHHTAGKRGRRRRLHRDLAQVPARDRPPHRRADGEPLRRRPDRGRDEGDAGTQWV